MKKGKGSGNGKNKNYWRNKIKNEKQQPKARFRGRVKSKGEQKKSAKSAPPQKGKKWSAKIKAERGAPARAMAIKSSKSPKINSKKRFKGKSANVPKLSNSKRTYTPPKRKKSSRIVQMRSKSIPRSKNIKNSKSNIVKAPKPASAPSGISKLRSASLKNMPAKAPAKAKATPVKPKGISTFKKNTARVANQPKPVKKVRQPVIKRGR